MVGIRKVSAFILCFALVFSFATFTSAEGGNTSEEYTYSVLFNENKIPSSFYDTAEKLGLEVLYEVPEIGFAQVKGTTTELGGLKGNSSIQLYNPSVSWEVPQEKRIEYLLETNEAKGKTKGNQKSASTGEASLWPIQWDIQRITENGASYELGTGSHDVVVGIVDTGIDRDHPDLVGNLLPGSENFVPAGGFRGTEPYETGDPGDFDDIHGHGSHVAGSIAGNGAMLGVAPDVGIRSYRVFGLSSAESAWIYDAMIAAANDDVDVISMSLGGFDVMGQTFYTDPETGEKVALGNDVADFIGYKRAVEYATKKGSLVVVAAGNDAINMTNKKEVTDFLNAEYGGDGLSFEGASFEVPGSIPGVVTVSATGPNDKLALYSNYGPGFVDIATVGGDIRTYMEYLNAGKFDEYLAKQLYYNEFCLSASEDGGYYFSVGTSMATPKVSAVAALIIDKYGKMSPAKVVDHLKKYGVEAVSGTDQAIFGAGHLNALTAFLNPTYLFSLLICVLFRH